MTQMGHGFTRLNISGLHLVPGGVFSLQVLNFFSENQLISRSR